jgi:endo-1,4-beta-xylanase
MKRILIGLAAITASGLSAQKSDGTLKKAFQDKFYIGTAMSLPQIDGTDQNAEIIKKQFSSIVAENCMKSMFIQPQEGKFFL